MPNPAKREATLIEKWGSLENYQAHWFALRTQTMKQKLGEAGYLEKQKAVAAKGGAKSKRSKKRKPSSRGKKHEDN